MEQLTSLSDLLDLQTEDSEIDRLLHERESLSELDTYRTTHEEAETARVTLTALEADQREVDLDLDKSEGELEILETKLEQHERRLFAGSMSAKETEHMRLEVQGLRAQREAMDVKVLALMESSESVDEKVEYARQVTSDVEGREERLAATIKSEWARIDGKVAFHESTKESIIKSIPPELISLYEGMRDQKEGVAVAALVDGICGGCHLTMSPSEQAEALSEDPPRCTNCRRIVVP